MWLVRNTWLGRWIFTFFKKQKPEIKKKVKEVEMDHTKLILEYHRIKAKKSSLSRAERDQVEARVLHLIGKGHIKIN